MNLEDLWKKRAGVEEMRQRSLDYKKFEDAYHRRGKSSAPSYMESFKPLMSAPIASQDETPKLLNPSAQVVKHFAAMFSRLPRINNVPYDGSPSSQAQAAKMTALLRSVANMSSMKALQPLQSHRLSLRGDAVYGVEWDKKKKQIYWRGFDPQFCFPSLNALDFGGVDNILIKMDVDRSWAKEMFKVDIDTKAKGKAKVFIYWDAKHKETQVEHHQRVGDGHTFEHKLGICPFRWVFAQPTGFYAQSDVQDVIEMSDYMNEAMVLALDSLRMNVYPAYWGRAIRENAVPKPGQIIAFNNPEAHVEKFETSPPPDMAMNLLGQMKREVQASGGISPVSAEGMIGGSIVTGTAVRHQVEAIEARAETKRVLLESAWSKIGEYTLKVLEKEFSDAPIVIRKANNDFDEVTGEDVKGWTVCEADYGVMGMDVTARQRWSLEGLGRVHDDYEAVRIAHPDADADEMVARITDFQIRQAEMSARSQVSAQKIAQEGQQQSGPQQPMMAGGGEPVPPSQMPGRPTPPAPSQMMQNVGGIQDALRLLGPSLHGAVWVVGEMAASGMAAAPAVVCEDERDVGPVQAALEKYHALVVPGEPDDAMPKTKVA